MALDPSVLQSSFDLVIEREPRMTARFYEILFTRYPEVRPLFGRDQTMQGAMLQTALTSVLERLEDAPWLASTLGAMGRKHLDYGVTYEMYDWVGECLLATLAEIAGEGWTPAVAAQWTEAYGAIAGLMQAGARAAEQEAALAASA
ncbi:MAG: globin domain-containing protein [Polyangiales bacterium]